MGTPGIAGCVLRQAQGGVFEEPSWAYQSQRWMRRCFDSVPLGQTVLNWRPFVLASHNTSVSSGEAAPTPANYIRAPPENPEEASSRLPHPDSLQACPSHPPASPLPALSERWGDFTDKS